MQRLVTGLSIAPFLWLAIMVAPAWAFQALAVVAICICTWECQRMMAAEDGRPFVGIALIGAVLLTASFVDLPYRPDSGAVLAWVTLVSILAAMMRRPEPGSMLRSVMRTVFPVVFVSLSLGYVVGLRSLGTEEGKDLVLLLFLCVIASDVTAYYIGRRFGRRPLALRLSPKKTWEGAVAGIVGSVLLALFSELTFYQRLPVAHAVVLGVVLGAAGIIGDLSESVIKRASGVKDSSSLLPGHGGLLDRLDGLLFAGPVLYYYYLAFLRGAT